MLAELKRPDRGWTGVVVGEGTRCWYGNQFSLIAPKFAAYGVDLWVPELGGKYDPRNPSHKMLMSQLGAMSEFRKLDRPPREGHPLATSDHLTSWSSWSLSVTASARSINGCSLTPSFAEILGADPGQQGRGRWLLGWFRAWLRHRFFRLDRGERDADLA